MRTKDIKINGEIKNCVLSAGIGKAKLYSCGDDYVLLSPKVHVLKKGSSEFNIASKYATLKYQPRSDQESIRDAFLSLVKSLSENISRNSKKELSMQKRYKKRSELTEKTNMGYPTLADELNIETVNDQLAKVPGFEHMLTYGSKKPRFIDGGGNETLRIESINESVSRITNGMQGLFEVRESKKNINEDFDFESEKRLKILKSKFPKVYRGAIDDLRSGLNSVSIMKTSDGTKFLFLDTPGHGWIYDLSGDFAGEEDGGFDDKYKHFNDELKTVFSSMKDII